MQHSLYTISRKVTALVIALVFVAAPLPFGGRAAAAELVCTPNDAQVITSDDTTQVLPESSAVEITPHPAWASIASSSWIWDAPLSNVDGYEDSHPVGSVTFSKNFEIATGTPTNSSIEIAADNTYTISINGNTPIVPPVRGDGNYYNPTEVINIPADQLITGSNNILIVAQNGPRPEGYEGANPAGLIYKATINSETCVVPPPDVTVTIVKYIDGTRATAENASSTSFSMTANYQASNLNGGAPGSGNYELDTDGFNGNPTPYQAITSDMTSGANYSTNENGVPTVCTSETQFALDGYKIGDTEEAAQAATTTSDATLTNITSSKYILVMNKNCNLVPPSLPEHVSLPDGTATSTENANLLDWTDSTSIHEPVTYTYQSATNNATNTDGSFVSPAYTSAPMSASEIVTTGTPEGVYYWHVKATDAYGNSSAWTAPWKIIIDNTNPTLPEHLSYANGSEMKTSDAVMLDWTDSTDTSPVTYLYESSTNPATSTDGSFETPAYESSPLTESSIPTAGTPEGTYYWHVKAVDAAGHESAWTEPWMIIIDNTGPSLPFHISPANDSNLTTATWLSADWSDSTDGSSSTMKYYYESSNSSSTTSGGIFQFPVYTSPELSTSTISTAGTPEGTYYWHVKAVDQAGNSTSWTDAWKVTVNNSTSTATSTPETPIATTTATSTIIVRPSDTQGWSTSDTRPGGEVKFLADATTPAGLAALQLTTNASTSAKAQYMHAASSTLASTTVLSYYTKQNSASFAGGLPSYQLAMFLTGTSTGFTTLVYEPYQSQSSTTVATSTWQLWDVASGLFWSSRTVSCGENTVVGAAGGPATYTLAQIRAMCPDATVGGFGVNIGTYNTDYDVETDLFNFNGTTYDFELDLATTTTPETPSGTGGGGTVIDPQLNPNASTGGGSGGGFNPNGGGNQTGGSTSTSTSPTNTNNGNGNNNGTGGDVDGFTGNGGTGGSGTTFAQNTIPGINDNDTNISDDGAGTTTASSTEIAGDNGTSSNSNQLAAVGSLFSGNSWWMWLLGILLLIILGYLGYRYSKNNTN